jgi:hypothetical protein
MVTPVVAAAALPPTGADSADRGINLALLAGLAVALALLGGSLAWAATRRARRRSQID